MPSTHVLVYVNGFFWKHNDAHKLDKQYQIDKEVKGKIPVHLKTRVQFRNRIKQTQKEWVTFATFVTTLDSIMKAKSKPIKSKHIASPEMFRHALQQAIKAYTTQTESRATYSLWWHDGEKSKSVCLGEFSTMAEFFALCDSYVGANLGYVFNQCSGMALRKRHMSTKIYVRNDGIVMASVAHVGGSMDNAPFVPLNPTETEYPYTPIVAGRSKCHTYTNTKIALL